MRSGLILLLSLLPVAGHALESGGTAWPQRCAQEQTQIQQQCHKKRVLPLGMSGNQITIFSECSGEFSSVQLTKSTDQNLRSPLYQSESCEFASHYSDHTKTETFYQSGTRKLTTTNKPGDGSVSSSTIWTADGMVNCQFDKGRRTSCGLVDKTRPATEAKPLWKFNLGMINDDIELDLLSGRKLVVDAFPAEATKPQGASFGDYFKPLGAR